MNNEILLNFLSIRDQLHIFHWTTDSGSKHNALGAAYEVFLYQFDKYMEVFLGKHPELKVTIFANMKAEIEYVKFSNDDFREFISNVLVFIQTLPIMSDDSDLAAIRDDMMSNFSKLMYLMTLD